MRRRARYLAFLGIAVTAAMAFSVFSTVRSAHADPVSGAIFTTDVTGIEVNVNQYAAKTDVYLNGGPGPGAPQTAAGLPDGNYYFQVTDPSGKTLLSSDNIVCREVTVLGGNITAIIPATDPGTGLNCTHNAGTPGPGVLGIPVQLFPFNDTPNNGGVYKAWMTNVLNYQEAGCRTVFGFCHSDSKTDNFKVKQQAIIEIDTTFYSDATGAPIDGLSEHWADTLGASNTKWSYTNLNLGVDHQAHIEGPEIGTHQITIANQTGCTITEINTNFQPGAKNVTLWGPGTISVTIPKSAYNNINNNLSWFINVFCA